MCTLIDPLYLLEVIFLSLVIFYHLAWIVTTVRHGLLLADHSELMNSLYSLYTALPVSFRDLAFLYDLLLIRKTLKRMKS